jgi:hypothetical protein
MHVQRSIVTVTDQKLVIDLPSEYLHRQVEVSVSLLPPATPANEIPQKRRSPPMLPRPAVEYGDVIHAMSEEDWGLH